MKDHNDNLQPETIDQMIEGTGSPLSDMQTASLLHQMQTMSLPDARANNQSLDRIWNRLHASHEHAFSSQVQWGKPTEHTFPEQNRTEKERKTMQKNDIPINIHISSSAYMPKRQLRRRMVGVVMMTATAILLIVGFILLSGRLQPASQAIRSMTVGTAGQPQISYAKADGQVCQITNDPATRNSALWHPTLSWSTQGQIAYSAQTTFKVVSARDCTTIFSRSVQNASQPTWSPDGKAVAVTADNSLYIFDNKGNILTHLSFAQLNALQAPEEEGIGIISWSSDNHQLFFVSTNASYREIIRSLNISQGNKVTDLTMLPTNSISDQISPDLQFALVISRNPVSQDKTLELWNIAKGQKIEAFSSKPSTSGPDVLAIDNTSLVRNDGDTLVQIYHLSDGKLVRSFQLAAAGFESAIWSPDGRFIAAGNHGVTIYDASTGKVVTTVARTNTGQQILSIAWSPDGKELATMTGPSNVNDPSAATFNIWKL